MPALARQLIERPLPHDVSAKPATNARPKPKRPVRSVTVNLAESPLSWLKARGFPMQPLARVHAVENSTTPNQNGDLNGL